MATEINKIYQHYKGDLYLVVGIGIHTETKEPSVIYRGLYGKCELYIRPLSMFEEILPDGTPRFKLIEVESKKI